MNRVDEGPHLSGTVHGSVVQARTVHGGIHLHPAAARRATPRQLPPPVLYFVDRDRDLEQLEEARVRANAAGAPPVVVVSGLPGAGKSAAATRWIRTLSDEYPDGQLHVDLHGETHAPEDPLHVIARMLRALDAGQAPVDLGEAVAAWRSATAGLRVVLLADNAASAAQVRPLLMTGPGTLMVVTSRWQLESLALDGAAHHPLGPLPHEAGHELLDRRLGAGRLAAEPESVAMVVHRCAGLPLALSVTAAHLATRPATAVRDLVAREAASCPVPLLDAEEHPVSHSLGQALAGLDPRTARLYMLVGLLPPQVQPDVPVAAALATMPPASARSALERLVSAHLLETRGAGRYRMLDPVREHAAARARRDLPEECGPAVRRALDALLATVAAAERLLCPQRDTLLPHQPEPVFPDPPTALAWLDEWRGGLMAMQHLAAEHGWHEVVWQLADGMWPLFHRLRHIGLWVKAHRIGLAAARASQTPAAVCRMLTSGAAGLNAAAYDEAEHWYAEARDLAAATGSPRAEGQALLGLGASAFEDQRPLEGIAPLEAAIEVWESIGYQRGVALTRILLGEIALTRHDLAHARDLFAAAFAYFDRDDIDDPFDHARTACFVALADILSGHAARGMEMLKVPLGYFHTTGSRYWYGRALEFRGRGAAALGDIVSAREDGHRAQAAWHGLRVKDHERLSAWLRGLQLETGGEP